MDPQCTEDDNRSEHEKDCNQTPVNPPLPPPGQNHQNENQEPLHKVLREIAAAARLAAQETNLVR
ncbi:7509_t:CDS:1, partial [Gigaspora rosea]